MKIKLITSLIVIIVIIGIFTGCINTDQNNNEDEVDKYLYDNNMLITEIVSLIDFLKENIESLELDIKNLEMSYNKNNEEGVNLYLPKIKSFYDRYQFNIFEKQAKFGNNSKYAIDISQELQDVLDYFIKSLNNFSIACDDLEPVFTVTFNDFNINYNSTKNLIISGNKALNNGNKYLQRMSALLDKTDIEQYWDNSEDINPLNSDKIVDLNNAIEKISIVISLQEAINSWHMQP